VSTPPYEPTIVRLRIAGLGLYVRLRVVETPQGYVWADGTGLAWHKTAAGWESGERVWAGDGWGIGP
jgi:hypothetical protein